MKKHIIGFTIFAFIVGSFVSIWALFGYFTQTIPNIPTVQTDYKPVFESDRRTSCFRQKRENVTYEIVDSYYFDDEKKIVSTVKVKWNGLGAAPTKVLFSPKYFIGGKEMKNYGSAESRSITFTNFNREINTSIISDVSLSKYDLKENVFVNLDIPTGAEYKVSRDAMPGMFPVTAVHGESSIIER